MCVCVRGSEDQAEEVFTGFLLGVWGFCEVLWVFAGFYGGTLDKGGGCVWIGVFKRVKGFSGFLRGLWRVLWEFLKDLR